jgi:CMP-N,N'-diacetyllegionaminic acid synthase
MYEGKTFLAIIPARGGSKRLPRKNILNLAGKPLIAWSIEAGLNSEYIDKVIVTSDDDEILEISRKFGADIIKRPDELANDTATTFDAIKHTIDNCEKYDYIVLLQPTSPLRNEKYIDDAIELLESKKADAIISVCEMDHSPLWSNILPEQLHAEHAAHYEVGRTRHHGAYIAGSDAAGVLAAEKWSRGACAG